MKTLIKKELRENLKLAVIGFLMAAAVVVGTQVYYVNLIEGIAAGISKPQDYFYRLQPLTSGNLLGFCVLCCILVALMFGWFQVNSERHRDLWAFLAHRPVSRSEIFLSKVIAGLFLYFISVGVPFAWLILWAATPGHVAAPFEWSMAGMPIAVLLAGVAWYFAGMLSCIRQARWYGSRALGLAAALIVMFAATTGTIRWWAATLLTIILAVAVWGAFHSRGEFHGQPAAGKVALTLALIPGMCLVVMSCSMLILGMFPEQSGIGATPHYSLGRDGIIYKISPTNDVGQVISPDGTPLKDPETGRPMESQRFNDRYAAPATTVSADPKNISVNPQFEIFTFHHGDRQTLWLNRISTGRVEAYDVRTRKCIGSIGPDGFAANQTGDGSRFALNSQMRWFGWQDGSDTMASTNALYQVNLIKRSVELRWSAPQGDEIKDFSGNLNSMNTLVITKKEIVFFRPETSDKKPVLTIPYTYSSEDNPAVAAYEWTKRRASPQPNTNSYSYSVWLMPYPAWTGFAGDSTLPVHVMMFDKNGEMTSTQDLPSLKGPPIPDAIPATVVSCITTPMVLLASPWLVSSHPAKNNHIAYIWSDLKGLSADFVINAVCAIVGIILGRRYSFSIKRQSVWTVFNLLFGIPGLLAFFAVQEWPARVHCEHCGKLRVVENEFCEYCSEGFPPPKKNGTEIFEALETT